MGGAVEPRKDLCAGPARRQDHEQGKTLGLASMCYSSSMPKALILHVFMWCDLQVFSLVLGIVPRP